MFGKYEAVKHGVTRGSCGPVDIWVVHMLSAIRLVCSVDIFGAERRQVFKTVLWEMLIVVLGQLGLPTGKTLFSPILTGGGLIVPDSFGNLFYGHTMATIRIRRQRDQDGWIYKVFEDDTELTSDKLKDVKLVIFIDECSASGASGKGALNYLISLGYRDEVWFACPVVSNYAVGQWARFLQEAGNPITLHVLCCGVYGIQRDGGFGHHKPLTDFVVLASQLPREQTSGCFIPTEQSRAFYQYYLPNFVSSSEGIICCMGDATDSLLDDPLANLKQLDWLLRLLVARSHNRELIRSVREKVITLRNEVARLPFASSH